MTRPQKMLAVLIMTIAVVYKRLEKDVSETVVGKHLGDQS